MLKRGAQEGVLKRKCSRGDAKEGVLKRVYEMECARGVTQEGLLKSKQATKQAPYSISVY